MRLWRLVFFSLLLAACAAPRAADSSEDLKAWQGTWKLVASTYDGEPQMADMEWIVDGEQYEVRLNGQSQEVPMRFKLDAAQKHIDAIHHETPKGTYGGKVKGVYKISGNSLTVCYDLTGTEYPKSFEAERGSRQVLYQFRRE